MPRYYCDYCGTYLTHDSAPGRRQHNRGWKHTDNVKLHYKQFVDDFIKKQVASGVTQQQTPVGGMTPGEAMGMRPGPSAVGMGMGTGTMATGTGSMAPRPTSNSLMPGGGMQVQYTNVHITKPHYKTNL
ncbi:unnamed protein product [Choristocarpus tenellus]